MVYHKTPRPENSEKQGSSPGTVLYGTWNCSLWNLDLNVANYIVWELDHKFLNLQSGYSAVQ